MKILVVLTQKNRVKVRMAALVLLAVALVVPQFTWADHASDHPYSQFDSPSSISASEPYVALMGQYKTGELVYNAPGRRSDSSSSSAPSEAYVALIGQYETGELVYNAPGRRVDSLSSVSANPELRVARQYHAARLVQQTDAVFLAANPETMASRRYAASQQAVAAAASSARWVALGEYYTNMGTTFLAANPGTMVSRRYAVSQQAVAAAASSARWVALGEYYTDMGATFLAANPEVMTYRRYMGQDGCSLFGQVC